MPLEEREQRGRWGRQPWGAHCEGGGGDPGGRGAAGGDEVHDAPQSTENINGRTLLQRRETPPHEGEKKHTTNTESENPARIELRKPMAGGKTRGLAPMRSCSVELLAEKQGPPRLSFLMKSVCGRAPCGGEMLRASSRAPGYIPLTSTAPLP